MSLACQVRTRGLHLCPTALHVAARTENGGWVPGLVVIGIGHMCLAEML
jgi:hypothetical protein